MCVFSGRLVGTIPACHVVLITDPHVIIVISVGEVAVNIFEKLLCNAGDFFFFT